MEKAQESGSLHAQPNKYATFALDIDKDQQAAPKPRKRSCIASYLLTQQYKFKHDAMGPCWLIVLLMWLLTFIFTRIPEARATVGVVAQHSTALFVGNAIVTATVFMCDEDAKVSFIMVKPWLALVAFAMAESVMLTAIDVQADTNFACFYWFVVVGSGVRSSAGRSAAIAVNECAA